MYCPAKGFHFIIGAFRKLASLKDERTESKSVPVAAAFYDFIYGKPVPCDIPVAFPDAAVKAVIAADVGDFYQSSDIYALAESFHGCFPGSFVQTLYGFPVLT